AYRRLRARRHRLRAVPRTRAVSRQEAGGGDVHARERSAAESVVAERRLPDRAGAPLADHAVQGCRAAPVAGGGARDAVGGAHGAHQRRRAAGADRSDGVPPRRRAAVRGADAGSAVARARAAPAELDGATAGEAALDAGAGGRRRGGRSVRERALMRAGVALLCLMLLGGAAAAAPDNVARVLTHQGLELYK